MMLAAIVTILGVYLATEVFIEDMEDDGEPAFSRAEMREAQAVLEAVTVSTGRAPGRLWQWIWCTDLGPGWIGR